MVETLHGDALAESRQQLCDRTEKVRSDMKSEPPPARPSNENCRHCQVKLLCEEYWIWKAPPVVEPGTFHDLRVSLVRPANESSWKAETHLALDHSAPSQIMLKRSQIEEGLWNALEPGAQLRLTD